MSDKQLTLENRIERLKMLSELGKTLTSTMQFDDLLKAILKKTSELLKPDAWHLLLKKPDKAELEYKILINAPSINREESVPMGQGIAGWVAVQGAPILWTQQQLTPQTLDIPENIAADIQNVSLLCAPLLSREKLLGVITLTHPDLDFFDEDDLMTLTTIADFAAIAIENAMSYERIEDMTIRDDLTQLYNQRYLQKILDYEIDRSNRYFKEFSMIFIDLDKFKQVNDTYGHVHGSDLLREAAEVIDENTRDVDHCARYGGDEFVILLPETGKDKALVSAERIRSAIEKREFLADKGINAKFTASFGVATFPTDAQTKDDLIKMADEAMYEAKHKNRNNVQGFEKKS